jgi:DNA replicative helicase MCM subunit Mcm2 (Cdc46/Mcm family)
MTIQTELTAVQKKLTTIKLKVDNLIAAVEKAETKTIKAPKAPVKKKVVRITDTDKVLNIIKRSKKGVDTATLVKKTGFDQKKVRNILQRTFKQGKIKRMEKGIYVGA